MQPKYNVMKNCLKLSAEILLNNEIPKEEMKYKIRRVEIKL